MKKSLVIIVVGLALSAMAQTAPQTTAPTSGQQPAQPMTPAQAAPAQPAQAAAQPCRPMPKKEIKDPAEYNSYTTSLNAADPKAKILGFENFVRLFPNSAYKEDALEQLMTAYQQAGDSAKMVDAAKQLLQVNPNNVRALALLSYIARMSASAATLQQSITDARNYGEKGLQALQQMPCPEGASPADVEKLQKQTSVIFHGAVGFAAYQAKDYATAQQQFQAAVNLEGPTAAESLNDVYYLALAYLEPKPLNPAGLWYIARAVALSNSNADILKYGKSKYIKYHGDEEGWDQVLATAKSAAGNAPPANLAIAPAPSPAEQAAKLAASKPVAKMSFDELQLIFTSGNTEVADRVWKEFKATPTLFAAKVIEASKTKLMLASTYDDVQANKADVELTMAAPLTAKEMPKVGEQLNVQGTPDTLDVNPFMIHMKDGNLVQVKTKTPPKAAPKKGATTHKKTTG